MIAASSIAAKCPYVLRERYSADMKFNKFLLTFVKSKSLRIFGKILLNIVVHRTYLLNNKIYIIKFLST